MDAFRQLIATEVDARMAARTQATADLITGLQVSLIHVFTILIAKGVLSRQEAIASIADTIRLNHPDLPQAAEVVLANIRQGLATQSPADPQSTAPVLRLIPGGLGRGDPPDSPS